MTVSEATCQKYALVGDKNRFVCKSDSIDYYFQKNYLQENQIDTIIKLHYFYDNGRYEKEKKALIWNENKSIKIKSIFGCDEITELGVVKYAGKNIFLNYLRDSLVTTNHELTNYSRSHDFGYRFEIQIGDYKKIGYIRDQSRGIDNFRSPGDKDKAVKLKIEAEKNQLIKWLNEIDFELNELLKKE